MKHAKYFLQFLFIGCLLIFFKIIGLKFSRVIASKLFSTFGPFFRSKKIIEQNISFAFHASDKEFKKAIISKIPSGNLGTGDDVSNCVAFLASDMASYINGETIHVNGGMYMA